MDDVFAGFDNPDEKYFLQKGTDKEPLIHQTIADLHAQLKQAEEVSDDIIKDLLRELDGRKDQLVAKEAELSRYKRAMEVVVECLMDNIETLRYALNYVKDRGLSAEKDVRDSIQVSEATLEAVRRLGEGE